MLALVSADRLLKALMAGCGSGEAFRAACAAASSGLASLAETFSSQLQFGSLALNNCV